MKTFIHPYIYRAFLTLVSMVMIFSMKAEAQVTAAGSGLNPTYPTLAAAIADLNNAIISSPVIIQLTGNEPAPVGGYSITAHGTAINTILIEGSASTITAGSQVAGSQNDAVFKIVGGDYITLQNFTIQENLANTNKAVATNTMTEWGIALLSDATRINGAQNNTIQNNIISLNSAYTNSVAIYSSVLHLPTDSPQTLTDITNASGSNSNNNIYNNTISSVACPIVFVGSLSAAFMDNGNEIGGSTSIILGNRITNWGNNAANSIAANVSTSVFGIYCNNQTGFTITNNTITSSSLSTTADTRAILVQYTGGNPTGSFSNTISNNTITLQNSNAPTLAYEVISTQGMALATATINITDNTLLNCTTGGAFTGIANASAPGTLNILRNIIKGTISSANSQVFYGFRNTGAVVNTINILNNQLGNSTGPFVTFSAVNTGAFFGISNEGGATATCDLSIIGNTFRGITLSVASSSIHTYINNLAATFTQTISNNTFTALNVNTSGNLTFISNNVALPSGGSQTVNNNSIETSFTKAAGATTVYLYYSAAAGNSNATIVHNQNNFSNITLSGATIMNGWSSTGDLATSKTFSKNTFSNWTLGTGTVTVMSINSGTSTLSSDTIKGITGAGAITGISMGNVGTATVEKNTIGTMSSSGAFNVNGITTVTPTATLSGNKIYSLTNTNVGGSVNGINITGGTTITLYNNIVGDLIATTSNNNTGGGGLVGINIVAGTTVNAYFNTVWLNNLSTTLGTNFKSSAIYVNTASTVDLRNNIFVNNSKSGTSGNAAAYRRSSTTLSTYSTSSNNNLFYASTGYVYLEIGGPLYTFTTFKTWVSPRDAASINENPPFASITGSSPAFLHISSACGNISAIESGGTVVNPPFDDFDGNLRFGSPGYTGDGFATDIGADEFNRQLVEVTATLGQVGPVNYPTLGAAFAKINTGVHKGDITIKLHCNTTETTTATLNASGGSASYSSVLIYPVVSGITISGSLASVPLIDLNGSDNVTINGSIGGTGETADLTISNTSPGGTGTSTIRMQGDATGNTITYCNVLGSSVTTFLSTTAGGNIWIGTGVTSGNDNNTISNCNIAPAGANLPTKCVYLYDGTSGIVNNNIVITDNNIYDYFSAANYSAGIYCGLGYTACSFTNNRLYQTAPRAQTVGLYHWGIGISNGAGTNYLISGNTIGYSSSTGTGKYTLNGVGGTEFYPIYLNVGGTTVPAATSVQGNIITEITCVNSGPAAAKWAGIYIANGLVYAGTAIGNTIGSAAGTGSISVTNNASASADVIGINYLSGTAESGIIQNNKIGSITTTGGTTYPANFYGIYRGSNLGTLTIRRNTIGSTLTPNSINAVSATTANPQVVCGIYNSTGATFDIFENTIANLSNSYAGTGAGAIIGIWLPAANLGSRVDQNFIHSLVAVNSNLPVYGIRIEAGSNIFTNNIISLGKNLNSGSTIYGIYENSNSTSILYFNTVFISGNASAGGHNTYALLNNGNANTRDFRDNILYNTRSGAGAKHYAIGLAGNSNLTINYNNYFTTAAPMGYSGGDIADLSAWQSATGGDANSYSTDPAFPVTNGIIANEFKPGTPQNGISGTGITTDYNGSARGSTPTIGALEGNTIITTSITPLAICSGSTITVNFISDGIFAAGNMYTVQLSNASGSFASPVDLASVTSNANSGSITNVPIPAVVAFPTGVGYKIRVVGSNPGVTNDAGTWLTISPTPVVPAQATTICSGTSPGFAPTYNWPTTIVPPGTMYTWSAPVMDAGVNGGSAQPVQQTSVNQVLTNSTSIVKTATYTVTPVFGTCSGTPFALVVTVNPAMGITDMSATTCNNQPFTIVPADGTNGTVPSGTTYSWTVVEPVDAGISGAEAGIGANLTGTLNNSSAIVQSASYTVIPMYETCEGGSFTATVNVNPTPELKVSSATSCDGQLFNFTAASFTDNTTFTWDRAAVPGISNAASSGTSAIISETLLNTQTYNIPVTYAFIMTANGCTNSSPQALTVIVVPIPVITVSSTPSGGVCLSAPPATLSMPFDLYSSSNLGTTQPNELFSENFESGTTGSTTGPNGWTTIITNATGTPITNPTQWIIRDGSYTTAVPPAPYLNVTMNSNTNDKFFVADNTRTLGDVITSLISPARSTIGYNTLTLEFWNYYRDKGPGITYPFDDFGYIEVSTDGGSTWPVTNQVKIFDETHGSPYSFVRETVDLSSFVGFASVKFRFRYHPTNDFYWAIDNIKLTGTSPVQGFSWTTPAFPAGYVNTVNVSPTGLTQSATTTYIAKYQDMSANCPASNSVTVTNFVPTIPTITPFGTVSFCGYVNNTVFRVATGDGTPRQWNIYGGAITDSTGPTLTRKNLPPFDNSVTANQTYSVTTTDVHGCPATSAETTVIIPYIGNNTIGDPQIVCSSLPANMLTQGPLPLTNVNQNPGYTFKWQSSTTSAIAGFTDASGTPNNLINYSPGVLTQTTWFRRKVYTTEVTGCNYLNTNNAILLTQGNQWIGNSSDWNDSGNWCGSGIPGPGTDVGIPAGVPNYPQVTITNAECKNLIVNAGASFQINAGKALTVNNDLTNNGTFTINSGALDQNGSLIVKGSGTGTFTYNRYVDADKWFILSSPLLNAGTQTALSATNVNTAGSPSTYNVATYSESANDWIYSPTLPITFTKGKGYLVKLKPSFTNVGFTGTLNTTMTDVPVQSTGTYYGWNAVGNPFTSALKITETANGFLDANSGKLESGYGAIYLWSAIAGNYKVINKASYTSKYGFVSLPDAVVQAGQGFLINVAKPANGETGYPNGTVSRTITFNKATSSNLNMQVHDVGTLFKKAESSWPGITLLATSDGRTTSTVVAFNSAMTTGLDDLYDAGQLTVSDFNLYTHLVEGVNQTNFTIQCLPDTMYSSLIVPIGIDLPQPGDLTFKVAGVILPDGIYPVIEDRLLQMSTPLKTENDSLIVDMPEASWGTDRFYLHFGGKEINAGVSNPTKTGKLTAHYSDQQITIFGFPEPDSKAWLYDVNGRTLGGEYSLTSANQNEIPAANLASGLYLLKIEGKTTRQTLKVTVLNR